MSRRERKDRRDVPEERTGKGVIFCSSCKRDNVELARVDIPLMIHHKKPLIAFCTACKKTWPENARPFKGPDDEEEEEE